MLEIFEINVEWTEDLGKFHFNFQQKSLNLEAILNTLLSFRMNTQKYDKIHYPEWSNPLLCQKF